MKYIDLPLPPTPKQLFLNWFADDFCELIWRTDDGDCAELCVKNASGDELEFEGKTWTKISRLRDGTNDLKIWDWEIEIKGDVSTLWGGIRRATARSEDVARMLASDECLRRFCAHVWPCELTDALGK